MTVPRTALGTARSMSIGACTTHFKIRSFRFGTYVPAIVDGSRRLNSRSSSPAFDVRSDESVDALANERSGPVDQAQAEQPSREHACLQRGHLGRQVAPQDTGALRARIGLRQLGDQFLTSLHLPLQFRLEFVDVLAFEECDLERLPRCAVGLDACKEIVQKCLDGGQRVGMGGVEQREIGPVDERQGHEFAHRFEQRQLVVEMPIDRAARHAGGLGDMIQRGPRDASAGEHAPCGRQNVSPRLRRLLLRSTHFLLGKIHNALFTYIYDCIYSGILVHISF